MHYTKFRTLIAEDEDITRKHLLQALKREGYEAVGVHNGLEAMAKIEAEHFDVLITDVKMPGMNGIELLEKVKAHYPKIEVLVVTGFGSIDSAVEAMKKGAYDYITKPFNLDELLIRIRNIHERKLMKDENTALKAVFGLRDNVSLIANSMSMRRIVTRINELSDSDCTVLLIGEKGVGRGLIARMLHATSRRQNIPFLTMHCNTMSEDILAKELFGEEQTQGFKKGLLEIAGGGTLFIREISGMSLALQARLLRHLEAADSGAYTSLVRFIVSSGTGFKELVSSGAFLEDLYSRLSMVEMFIPPLRDRREDILPLCNHFLKKHISRAGHMLQGFSPEAIEVLSRYHYPGNVLELENIIERAVIIEKSFLINSESLPIK